MRTIEIPEENLKWYIPSNLGECTTSEYIDMCDLVMKWHTGQIDYLDMKLQAVYKLFNLKQSKKELSPQDELDKWSNIERLSNFIDDFFEENNKGQKVLRQNYITNPVPSIALWKRYHGPSDQFLNIKFGEYLDALRLFHEFPATGDKKILYLIAAILYRPGKPFLWIRKRLNNYDGDKRVDYNMNHIEARAKTFQAFPEGFIYGTYLLFASFQQFLTTATIPWGGREIDLSILYDGQDGEMTGDTYPGIGMDALSFSLAESGAFGSLSDVKNSSLWEILIRLYDLRKRDLDNKKQEENDKRNQP
jgi:hypothetical protein